MLLESKNTASARAGAAAPNFYRAGDLGAAVRAKDEEGLPPRARRTRRKRRTKEGRRILGAMLAPREHAGLVEGVREFIPTNPTRKRGFFVMRPSLARRVSGDGFQDTLNSLSGPSN